MHAFFLPWIRARPGGHYTKDDDRKKIKKKSSNNPLDLRLARIHAAKAKEDLQLGAPAPMRAGFLLHPQIIDASTGRSELRNDDW
jgi:hypothetical protein